MIIFLFAGQDTTATTLTYTLWSLGRHPEIQDRLAAEVAAIGDRRLTTDDVERLGYTVQAIKEALRMCPPGADRLTQGDTGCGGGRVPGRGRHEASVRPNVGTTQSVAMGESSVIRSRPLQTGDAKDRDRWHYVPFGAAAHAPCIGDHFAMLAIATIIREVQITALDPDFPLAVPFTIVSGGPIRARVTAR